MGGIRNDCTNPFRLAWRHDGSISTNLRTGGALRQAGPGGLALEAWRREKPSTGSIKPTGRVYHGRMGGYNGERRGRYFASGGCEPRMKDTIVTRMVVKRRIGGDAANILAR